MVRSGGMVRWFGQVVLFGFDDRQRLCYECRQRICYECWKRLFNSRPLIDDRLTDKGGHRA